MAEEVVLTGDALRPEQVLAVAERRAPVVVRPGRRFSRAPRSAGCSAR